MCWSAQVDLVAGGLIAGVGVLCLARAARHGQPGRLLLAALPLVLGLHQLIEALVWLSTDGRLPDALGGAARTAWAAIALPLLPVLIPTGVWCAASERSYRQPPTAPAALGPARRRALAALAVLGLGVAVPLSVAVAAHPVSASVHGHTLAYGVGVAHPAVLLSGYLVATVGALLLSGDRLLRRLGLVTGFGALLCGLLWQLAFISTWCALAALASILLFRWSGRTPNT
ncbi:DUF6629 family protein [Kitasatospora sp. NPDC051170]|uniref:DUF6629 family protein n=1 Tax=Kitasatospora sp. NPDC051170 TaxID=3364056 RepID=UPI0037872634